MALSGTLQDFGLGEIFQMIGIQRKTGVLALDNGDDCVTVKFLAGQVVGADTRNRTVEDLLGAVLVRTGRLTEDQLRLALQIQKKTLQRLGYVLVSKKLISEEDLMDALRVQSLQIVYRLFRWREGSYEFNAEENLEYDEEHFVPISAETILMEGARMIDEWPIIERRIKSDDMLFKQTAAAAALPLVVESIVDADLDFDFQLPGEEPGEPEKKKKKDDDAIELSVEEREVLSLVNGQRSVEEITDCCTLGEFDTHRILAELLTRQLIEEIKKTPVGEATWDQGPAHERLTRMVLHAAVLGLIGLGLATLGSNPFTPWRLAARDPGTEQLRQYAAQSRLERIEHAIQVFYLDAGAIPESLELLASEAYLAESDLLDPWGRPFAYRITTEGYDVFAVDGEGEPIPGVQLERRLSPAQRRMLDPATDPPEPSERAALVSNERE